MTETQIVQMLHTLDYSGMSRDQVAARYACNFKLLRRVAHDSHVSDVESQPAQRTENWSVFKRGGLPRCDIVERDDDSLHYVFFFIQETKVIDSINRTYAMSVPQDVHTEHHFYLG